MNRPSTVSQAQLNEQTIMRATSIDGKNKRKRLSYDLIVDSESCRKVVTKSHVFQKGHNRYQSMNLPKKKSIVYQSLSHISVPTADVQRVGDKKQLLQTYLNSTSGIKKTVKKHRRQVKNMLTAKQNGNGYKTIDLL